MNKRGNMRIQGSTKRHVLRIAEDCGIIVRRFFERKDGTYFGYGLTRKDYRTEGDDE